MKKTIVTLLLAAAPALSGEPPAPAAPKVVEAEVVAVDAEEGTMTLRLSDASALKSGEKVTVRVPAKDEKAASTQALSEKAPAVKPAEAK